MHRTKGERRWDVRQSLVGCDETDAVGRRTLRTLVLVRAWRNPSVRARQRHRAEHDVWLDREFVFVYPRIRHISCIRIIVRGTQITCVVWITGSRLKYGHSRS